MISDACIRTNLTPDMRLQLGPDHKAYRALAKKWTVLQRYV
jgi:hypothetical protein